MKRTKQQYKDNKIKFIKVNYKNRLFWIPYFGKKNYKIFDLNSWIFLREGIISNLYDKNLCKIKFLTIKEFKLIEYDKSKMVTYSTNEFLSILKARVSYAKDIQFSLEETTRLLKKLSKN